jgi:lysozyme family protein
MNFDEAFALLIPREGGYVNNPNDPGGETKFGISKRAYPHLDIANLTLEQAKAIYLSDYWNKALCPSFPDPLRFQLFDTAVNSGARQAVVLLQRALKVADDGIAGPKTMEAVASVSSVPALAIMFISQRLRFMASLTTWEHFGKGWARRIADNLEEAAHEL